MAFKTGGARQTPRLLGCAREPSPNLVALSASGYAFELYSRKKDNSLKMLIVLG